MSKLECTIKELYNESDYLIKLIRRYDFENFLNTVLQKIEVLINEPNKEKITQLATLTLIKVNENIKNIDKKDKEKLEYLLSDIFQYYLLQLSENELLLDIQNTLSLACHDAGYNFAVLESMLNFKKNSLLKPNIRINNRLPFYEWLGKDYEQDELLRTLQNKGIIRSIKNFRNIFKPINNHFVFEASSDKITDLIIIFDILKVKRLIKPKVLSGHFTPLEKYGIDNEGMYLFRKAPNRIHELSKRDKYSYRNYREVYEKMIKNIASKTLGQ